jgi:hypothetical protein
VRVVSTHMVPRQLKFARLAVSPGAAGIEPASCSTLTESASCLCENCQHPCAARALQTGGPNCHLVSSFDADLQRVIAAWDGLPAAIRRATLALIGSQQTSRLGD